MPTSATCRNRNRARVIRYAVPPAAFTSRSGSRRGQGRAGPPVPGSLQGFTLLELVVVLLLLALVTAIAVPNLGRLYEGVVRSTERDYILDQFTGLGRRAMQQGRTYVIFGTGGSPPAGPAEPGGAGRRPGDPEPALGPAARPGHEPHVIDLPEGWEISLDEPLVIRANGVCLGAELTLRHRGAVNLRIRLEPPYCRIVADA